MSVLEKKSFQKSKELFVAALDLMPGGVNSPVRAFKSINSNPVFIKKAQGPYIWDEDDNQYIDYVGSWGPMILGHADPDIESNLKAAISKGTSFGAPTALENEMAAEIIKLVPSVEMVRMVNSGTEAVMSAIRLARAYAASMNGPGCSKIIKFSGCYHGHVDPLLVHAGSGVATLGLPDSPGVNASVVQDTIVLPFNNKEAVQEAFKLYRGEIAAIITEPIIGNAGCILPQNGFLEFLREISAENKALLIFDEVMTGFRVALGGAQALYKVTPDLTTLGKIIGGGLPVGAYGGRREIMEMVAPAGPMYQAGTLSGNPLAMTAGLSCLRKIQRPGFYEELERKTTYLAEGFKRASAESSISEIRDAQFNYACGMFSMFFTDKPVYDYESAKLANLDLFRKYYLGVLFSGVYFAPSAFEAAFMSQAHSYEDLDHTIAIHAAIIRP
jgi:glutamate-1-semialdehyde 2,1-aminomutase